MNSIIIRSTLCSVLLLSCSAWASEPAAEPAQEKTKAQESQVYGYQLMTPEERKEHRTKMRTAKTAEERDAIRQEHHKKMQERAKEKGITLPDVPPVRGMGANR